MSAPPPLELTLLGSPLVKVDGQAVRLRPPVLALLAYLVLEGPCSRSDLFVNFYGLAENADEKLSKQVNGRLRTTLLRLRQSGLRSALKSEADGLSLEACCDALDLQTALKSGDLERAQALFSPALLEHVNLESSPSVLKWLEGKRRTLSGDYLKLLGPHLSELILKGQLEDALSVAWARLTLDPDSVAYCDAVVERLLALNRRGEAEQLQVQFKARLERDLGLTPELVALPSLKPARSSGPGRLERPPLVGREALWDRVEAWFGGPGGVLVLRGEAGVGKSRLAQECGQARGGPLLTLQGRESAQDLAYGALEPLLSRESARWPEVKARWARELEALLPELGGTPREEQRVQNLLSPVRQRKVLSEALLHLLAPGGLLLLEDLHWLDPASLRVVGHMLLEHKQARLKVMATVRPGLEHPEWAALQRDLERAGALTALEVAPLTQRETLTLLRQLAGRPLPPKLASRLFERSGGNPYALLSLVRGLVEDGGLRRDSVGRWELPAGSSLEDTLPARASEALLRQLGAVPDPVWRLLESAALLGLEFDFEAAFAGSALGDEDTALGALEHLRAQRTVQDLHQGTHPYGFAHDLLRQAVAGRLSPARSKRIHHRLAQHLERHGARAAQVAHHWQAAGDLLRALPHWQAAAQEAARLHAHREALSSFEQALACAPSALERLPLRFSQVWHLKSLADLEGWGLALQQVENDLNTAEVRFLSSETCEEYDLRLVLERTHLLWRAGKLEEALNYSAPFAQGPMQVWRGHLLHDRGAILNDLGRRVQAWEELQGAFVHLDEQDTLLRANLLNALAQTAEVPPHFHEGLEHGQNAVALFKALGAWAGQASAWASCAHLHRDSGDLVGARAAFEQSVYAAGQANNPRMRVHGLHWLCEVLAELGDWPAVNTWATEGLELCEQEGRSSDGEGFWGWINEVKRRRSHGGHPHSLSALPDRAAVN